MFVLTIAVIQQNDADSQQVFFPDESRGGHVLTATAAFSLPDV